MSSLVGKSLRKNKSLLWNISQEIWKHPELCFEEIFAHDILATTLESFGFSVKRQYLLSTAFRAEFDSGREGPTIAAICEYDALPGIGHACGHNLIAEIGLGIGLAVKDVMENDPTVGGKIVVLGTPAEEGGGGKIKLIEKGAFKDIDAAMMAHPQSINRLYPLIVESAIMTVNFTANFGENSWEGPSAVDAAVACYNNIALLRRTIKETWRISLIIPTSSFEESKVEFIYRAPTQMELHNLRNKIDICIKSAAETTNCAYTLKCGDNLRSAYRGFLYNKTMTELFGKHAKAMGAKFYDNDPRFVESAVSSDMGNVSQVVPGMQPEFYIGAVSPHVNHTSGFADFAASDEAQEYTFLVLEALSKTAVDLLSNLDLMQKVKEEFEENPLRDPESHKRKAGEK